MKVLRVYEDGHCIIHIPGSLSTTYETLCGFCDTFTGQPDDGEQFDGTPDCPSCLEILAYCKLLKMPKRKGA